MVITQNGVLQKDDNGYPVMGGTSSVDDSTVINAAIDPITRRMLVDMAGGGDTFYTDTVSGTINGSNVTFTVANTISSALVLYLANSAYQPGVDFTVSDTTITMTVAPDASLSGQPFWLLHT